MTGGWDKGKEGKESREKVGDGRAPKEMEQVIESVSQSEFGESDMKQNHAKGRPTWLDKDSQEAADEWGVHGRGAKEGDRSSVNRTWSASRPCTAGSIRSALFDCCESGFITIMFIV
jgi:hypothetical protein